MTAVRFEVMQAVEISNTTKHELCFDTYMDSQGTIRVVIRESTIKVEPVSETGIYFGWEEAARKIYERKVVSCANWYDPLAYLYLNDSGKIYKHLKSNDRFGHRCDMAYCNADHPEDQQFFDVGVNT